MIFLAVLRVESYNSRNFSCIVLGEAVSFAVQDDFSAKLIHFLGKGSYESVVGDLVLLVEASRPQSANRLIHHLSPFSTVIREPMSCFESMTAKYTHEFWVSLEVSGL